MVTKILVSQNNADCQMLRVPATSRVIASNSRDWQLVFTTKSAPTVPVLTVKMGAIYNSTDLDSIRMVAYIYNAYAGSVPSSSGCSFDIYKVVHPSWSDTPVLTVAGTALPNSYYYADVPISSLGEDFLGETNIMIECSLVRLGKLYRDRIYVNHLGIFNNCFRLGQEIQYLDLVKKEDE